MCFSAYWLLIAAVFSLNLHVSRLQVGLGKIIWCHRSPVIFGVTESELCNWGSDGIELGLTKGYI